MQLKNDVNHVQKEVRLHWALRPLGWTIRGAFLATYPKARVCHGVTIQFIICLFCSVINTLSFFHCWWICSSLRLSDDSFIRFILLSFVHFHIRLFTHLFIYWFHCMFIFFFTHSFHSGSDVWSVWFSDFSPSRLDPAFPNEMMQIHLLHTL